MSLPARQYPAPTDFPYLGNDVVDNSVGGIYLVRITALIFERKNDDGQTLKFRVPEFRYHLYWFGRTLGKLTNESEFLDVRGADQTFRFALIEQPFPN